MTRNSIIEKLYLSKGFNDCLAKMEPQHLQDDLRSEVVLILMETPEEKIIQLDKDEGLKFYAVRIILNLVQSNTSPFAKMYRRVNCSIEETPVIKMDHGETLRERKEREDIEDRIKHLTYEQIDRLYWYDKEMILLYQKHGSFREIEKHTRIPLTSCYATIKKAMNTIKRNIELCQK